MFSTSNQRIQSEKDWHDSEDVQRNKNQLISNVYASDLFAEAEAHFLNSTGPVQGFQILDFGCGTAHTSYQLQAKQAKVTGIDLSVARIMEGKGWYSQPSKQNDPNFVIAAGEYLPFGGETFDAVFGKQILHHVILENAMPEIVRVLKKGGRAVFLEPLRHNPILEGYRRLTPHLRSPSEKALSIRDLEKIGSYFQKWHHQEFIFLSALPILIKAMFHKKNGLENISNQLQKMDRFLARKTPFISKYYWETVIILEK